MSRFFGLLFGALGISTIASAHFVWVVPQPNGNTAQVFLSEELKFTGEVEASIVAGTKLSLRGVDGHETPLELKKPGTEKDATFTVSIPGQGQRLIHGIDDLGLMQQGGKSYVLVDYPKTILGDAFDAKARVGDAAPVEIVPVGKPGAFRLEMLAHGKPQPKAELTVILPDGMQKKMTADASGQTGFLNQTGRFGVWGRNWETASGQRDGQAYSEIRNYATLLFDAPAASEKSTKTSTAYSASLPEASASFGAVASDGWLYVYGGHIAVTHAYSTSAVSGKFARLRLDGGTTWEQLPSGPSMQGMNLAAYRGKIYRIGGMAPRNQPGKSEETWSIADCARFDPASMKWEALPPLPEGRSSHDVAVIDGKLIVAGGWELKGKTASAGWFDTIETMDLNAEKPVWTSAPQPFKRRALIAAAHQGKMYLMGGMDDHNNISHDVDIYDPRSSAWSKGPALPGGEIDGFSPAAAIHEGALYVSLADGSFYRLNDSKAAWEKAGTTTARVAHRMVSDGKEILIMGGADKGKDFNLIEAVQATHN